MKDNKFKIHIKITLSAGNLSYDSSEKLFSYHFAEIPKKCVAFVSHLIEYNYNWHFKQASENEIPNEQGEK